MTTKERIFKAIEKIPEEKLPELFDLVKEFKEKRGGAKRGGKWAEFAGIFTKEEGRIMKEAIEREFGQVENEG